MKRISETGYVPAGEKEASTLEECGLDPKKLRAGLKKAIIKKKKDAEHEFGQTDLDRVRVTVTIDVEKL